MKGLLIKPAVLAILAVAVISCQDDTGALSGGELLLAAADAPVSYRESLYDGEGELLSVSDIKVYSRNTLAKENRGGLFGLPYDLHQPWNYAAVRTSVSSGSDRAWLTGDDLYAYPCIQSEMFNFGDRVAVNQLVYESDGRSVSSRVEFLVTGDRMIRANQYSAGPDALFNTGDDVLERYILYSYNGDMRLAGASEWSAETRAFISDIVWEYDGRGRILSIRKYSSHEVHDETTITGNCYRFSWLEEGRVEILAGSVPDTVTGRALFELNGDGTVSTVVRYGPGEDTVFYTEDDIPMERSFLEYQDGMRSSETVYTGDGSTLLFFRSYEY